MADGLPDLVTDRMILRQASVDDLDDLAAMNAEPDVLRFINGGVPFDRSETETWLRDKIDWSWVGRLRNPDSVSDFVGVFGISPTIDGVRELGYRLPTHRWGSGYGTEGSRAVIEYGFASWGLSRIWAQTMTVNTGSRRVMEKSGLTFVGMLDLEFDEPIPGSEHGDVEYEITRATWEQSRSAQNG